MNRGNDSLTTHPVRGHQLDKFQEEVAIAHPQISGKNKTIREKLIELIKRKSTIKQN